MNNPKISVIMPVYNGEKYLKEAIDSILNQTFTDFEFIIINDGSTDESETIIKSYNNEKIRLINNQINSGLTKALNKGLGIARGRYIARQDADDISMSNRFEIQYNFLKSNPNIALIGGWAKIIDEKGKQIRDEKKPLSFEEIKFHILFQNPFIHSTIFFRKDIIQKIGGYSEKYKHAEDFELYSRLIKKDYSITNIPIFLIKYRIHKDSICQTPKTREIQKETTEKIIFDNINNYLTINNRNFNIICHKEKIISVKKLFKAMIIYKRIFNSYIKKENLLKEQSKRIESTYNEKRIGAMKWYIKNKLRILK